MITVELLVISSDTIVLVGGCRHFIVHGRFSQSDFTIYENIYFNKKKQSEFHTILF